MTIGYLLDANHLGEAITRISRVRERLAQAMLAALTQQMGLRLLTTDRDFEALSHLRTENWLSP